MSAQPLTTDEPMLHDNHEEHDVEFLEALNPPPSYWPILLALLLLTLPTGILMILYGEGMVVTGGYALSGVGLLLSLIPTMGWCHSVIVDKWEGHFGVVAQGKDLALGTKLFFLSEIAIFGSIFAYHYAVMFEARADHNWPLPGTPANISLFYPALGLIVLVISSVTCEFAHKGMMAGKRGSCKNWLIVTMLLGLFFLAIQGFEYGIFIANGFTPATNTFSTAFFILTGFHGFHVMTGLIMLMIVYARLEIGHYHKNRHFSMMAASWYWHLVDVVWIVVFTTVYCLWDWH